MARETGLSHTTVRRIWGAFGLQPHRSETFKLSSGPALRRQGVRYRRALPVAARPGAGALRRREEPDPGVRPYPAGAADAARHPRAAHPRLQAPRHHLAVRGARRRHRLDNRQVLSPPPGEGVPRLPQGDRPKRPRRAWTFISSWTTTPPTRPRRSGPGWRGGRTGTSTSRRTSASWLNQVERWFAELTRKQLQRGAHRSIRKLEDDIRVFIDRHNQDPKPFKWTKSADDILAAVKRFCLRVEQNLCHEL